ncbi:class I SAM-dependent methyltransferase [Lacinutrix chionoecetis]
MEKKHQTNISVKDYSVSGEAFKLVENKAYGYLETQPQPSLDKLSDYYESEDYISHTNSKRNLFERVYHVIRNISLKRKIKLINSFNTNEKKILDIGCGTGAFLKVAKDNGWEVVGIEPNEKARTIANTNCLNAVYDVDQLEVMEPERFDVITLWHVLEHLPNLAHQVSILKTLLKPNGVVVVAVPNYKSYDASFYKNFWAAYDVPRHLWHFNKASVSKLFKSKSMTVEKELPMLFDAFYVSLLSEKYKTNTMNPFRAFFVGLYSNLKALGSGEYSSIIYIIKND